jgi:hypothetical protein
MTDAGGAAGSWVTMVMDDVVDEVPRYGGDHCLAEVDDAC